MTRLVLLILLLVGQVQAAPRGVRNNNPGNIASLTPTAWVGAYAIDDAGYLIFKRKIDGVRAIVINLRLYNLKHRLCTVNGIIRRWTNISDTPEQQARYVAFVASRLGVRPGQRLNMNDPLVIYRLTRAIVFYENGQDPYSDRLYLAIFPTLGRPR